MWNKLHSEIPDLDSILYLSITLFYLDLLCLILCLNYIQAEVLPFIPLIISDCCDCEQLRDNRCVYMMHICFVSVVVTMWGSVGMRVV